jgi:hypothetical protein
MSQLSTKTDEAINTVDSCAILLLLSFIKDSFPCGDPAKQVALAYLYAELICAYKRHKFMPDPWMEEQEEEKAP